MSVTPKNPKVQYLLESAYRDFHSLYHRARDPVTFAHGYSAGRDREIAAFFAALLAYGNVRTILGSVGKVLGAMGDSPFETLREGRVPSLAGFRHRFTTGEDLEVIAHWTGSALRQHGSLENFFAATAHPLESPMRTLLSDFVIRFTAQELPPMLARRARTRAHSLKYLLSDPLRGSACKRLNMFLRWVVRDADHVDLGLWKCLRKNQLMLPVDTHLLQTLRLLRWTKSKQATWRVVEAATERLRKYAPDDPVKFDFALCHLSMTGGNLKQYAKVE